MADVHPDPRAVFSHLGPAIFDLRNMNPFQPAGLLFRFPLLHIDRPNRGDVLRAFLENLAFAIRGNCEQLANVSGVPVATILVSGGLTQSPTLLRLIATSLGVPLEVCEVPESASLGCAMLAAVGAGLHGDVPAAVAAMTRTRSVGPDADRVAAYDDRYQKWRATYGTLREWTLS
jgi:sugar (pentulose or hexulose) kinase